ncbi:MAG: septal ring lytic transglycosylase RlpA family protein [bacterium]|nr:septal ring lytic transglycosylase RlpA family protein [bacterium]
MRRALRPTSLALVAVLGLLAGCGGGPSRGGGGEVQVGLASFYADRFHGRTTASGEVFDMHAMTAAHKTLPFGTRVRVTRLDTGRDVIVRINDRGPFVAGRIIDLSRKAAQELDMLQSGVVRVRVRVLDDEDGL